MDEKERILEDEEEIVEEEERALEEEEDTKMNCGRVSKEGG